MEKNSWYKSCLLYLIIFSFICTMALDRQVARADDQDSDPTSDEQFVVIAELAEPKIEFNYDNLKAYQSSCHNMQETVIVDLNRLLGRDIEIVSRSYFCANSLSFSVKKSELSKLSAVVKQYNLTIDADIFEPLTPQERKRTRRDLKDQLNGSGTLIAVIDSGIHWQNSTFAMVDPSRGKFNRHTINELIDEEHLPGAYYSDKVIYAYNYADENDDLNDRAPSHGTHVSAIAAGSKGQAPNAQLAVLRVFNSRDGRANRRALYRALDHAILLKADVINLSLGVAAGLKSVIDPKIDKAEQRAKELGIAVSVAVGNNDHINSYITLPNADNPDYGIISDPAIHNDSFAVASVNSANITSQVLRVGEEKFPFLPSFNAEIPFDKEMEFVFAGVGSKQDFAAIDAKQKAVLIERGGDISFEEKLKNAIEAGATAMLVYNDQKNDDGFISMQIQSRDIVAVSIRRSDAERLHALKGALSFSREIGEFAYDDAGELSEFSSWGPSNDLDLKPDITAPGGNIFNAVSKEDFATLSGTSMASPFISGLFSKLVERVDKEKLFKDLSPSQRVQVLKNIIMSNAHPLKNNLGNFASPRKQGAGIADVDQTLAARAYIVASEGRAKITLGNVGEVFPLEFKIVNFSESNLNYVPTIHLTTDALTDDGQKVNLHVNQKILEPIICDSVDVPAHSEITLTYEVDISASAESLLKVFPNGFFIDGYVNLAEEEHQQPLSVPLLAFYNRGDRQAFANLPVLEKAIYDFNFDREKPIFYDGKTNNFTALYGRAHDQNIIYGLTDSGSKKPIIFSPNGDGNFDEINFQGVFLRDFYLDKLEVLDVSNMPVFTSRTYYKKLTDPGRRNYILDAGTDRQKISRNKNWKFRGIGKNKEILTDGYYTLNFQAQGLSEQAQPQVMSFPIILDTHAPHVEILQYEDNRLRLKISDEYSQIVKANLQVLDDDNNLRDSIAIELQSGEAICKLDPQKKMANYRIEVEDEVNNNQISSLEDLLGIEQNGKISCQFIESESGKVLEVDPADYTIVVRDKDGIKRDPEHLPLGSYHVKVELLGNAYDSVVTEQDVVISKDQLEAIVRVETVKHMVKEVVIYYYEEAAEQHYPGTPELVAIDINDGREYSLDFSGGAVSGQLRYGTYRIEARNVLPGWYVSFGNRDTEDLFQNLVVDETHPTESLIVTYSKNPGKVEVELQAEGEVKPDISFVAVDERGNQYTDLNALPYGYFYLKALEKPVEYYLAPDYRVFKITPDATNVKLIFKTGLITQDSVGSVKINTTCDDPTFAGAEFIAENFSGDVRTSNLDALTYGTWYIRPVNYDRRYLPDQSSIEITIEPDVKTVEINVKFSLLDAEKYSGLVRINKLWADSQAKEKFETDASNQYKFSFYNHNNDREYNFSYPANKNLDNHFETLPFGYYTVKAEVNNQEFTLKREKQDLVIADRINNVLDFEYLISDSRKTETTTKNSANETKNTTVIYNVDEAEITTNVTTEKTGENVAPTEQTTPTVLETTQPSNVVTEQETTDENSNNVFTTATNSERQETIVISENNEDSSESDANRSEPEEDTAIGTVEDTEQSLEITIRERIKLLNSCLQENGNKSRLKVHTTQTESTTEHTTNVGKTSHKLGSTSASKILPNVATATQRSPEQVNRRGAWRRVPYILLLLLILLAMRLVLQSRRKQK